MINPSDVNAIYGTKAQFRCLYAHQSNESAILTWRFTTQIIDKVESVAHSGNETNSILVIRVTNIEYNQTEVHCQVVITESDSYVITRTDESKVAKLYVRGKVRNCQL